LLPLLEIPIAIVAAIALIEEDRRKDGGAKYLDFARKVNNHQCVMSLWQD